MFLLKSVRALSSPHVRRFLRQLRPLHRSTVISLAKNGISRRFVTLPIAVGLTGVSLIGFNAADLNKYALFSKVDALSEHKKELGWTEEHEELFEATRNGDVTKLRKMLDSSSDVSMSEAKHPFGWSLLHVAVVNERVDVIKELIKRGVDLDCEDDYDLANLSRKASYIYVLIVREAEFCDRFKPNAVFKGCTPLHYAVLMDNYEIAKLLLESGASPLKRTVTGHKPIEFANQKSEKLVRLLENSEKSYAEHIKKKELEERRRYPLEQRLREKLVGQESAINTVAAYIRRKGESCATRHLHYRTVRRERLARQ